MVWLFWADRTDRRKERWGGGEAFLLRAPPRRACTFVPRLLRSLAVENSPQTHALLYARLLQLAVAQAPCHFALAAVFTLCCLRPLLPYVTSATLGSCLCLPVCSCFAATRTCNPALARKRWLPFFALHLMRLLRAFGVFTHARVSHFSCCFRCLISIPYHGATSALPLFSRLYARIDLLPCLTRL